MSSPAVLLYNEFTHNRSPADPIVTLKVGGGDQARLLRVHQGVLCKTSVFFQRAMKPEWANQRDEPHVIDMSDDSAELVEDYINWRYSGEISVVLFTGDVNGPNVKRDTFAAQAEEVYVALAKAYVFGDKVLDASYKNAVLSKIADAHKACNWTLAAKSSVIIYAGTTPGSSARRLLSDMIANDAYDDSALSVGWMAFIPDLPQELLADAMKTMLKLRPVDKKKHRPWSINLKSYYEKPEA
jgi:hypothetical protein